MDNKITDKGWTAMRTLLDREMPEKRSRRLVWWWIGLLLLPIAVYGTWDLMKSSHSKPSMPELKSVAPVASNTVNNHSIAQPTHSGSASSVKSTSSSEQSISASENRHFSRAKTFAQPVKRDNKNASSTINSGINISQPAEQSIVQHSTALQNSIESYSEISLIWLPIPFQNLDIEPTTKKLDLNATIASSIPTTVKKTRNPHPWRFGVGSVFTTEQFNSVNGYSSGATVDWKFARNWGLRSGFFYNIHTPQEDHRPIASVQSEDYTANVEGKVLLLDLVTGVELITTGSNSYSDSLASDVLIPVNRLERLEMPINVFWQPYKPIKLFGGLCIARTVSTKADNQNYSGAYVLKLNDKVSEDGASRLSSSELNRWSADATLGAGFSLGKSIELGFVAKMPLSKFKGLSKSTESLHTSGAIVDKTNTSINKQGTPLFSLYGTLYF